MNPSFNRNGYLKFVCLIGLSLWLTACGFHLRGYNLVPAELKTLYLESVQPYSPFTVQLRQDLQSSGVKLVNHPQLAPYTLQLLDIHFSQKLSSISGNTQVRTYELIYHVVFQIKNSAGKVKLKPQTVAVQSTYTTSDTQLLADSSVLTLQEQQMRRRVIQKIFYRLNSDKAKQALQKTA